MYSNQSDLPLRFIIRLEFDLGHLVFSNRLVDAHRLDLLTTLGSIPSRIIRHWRWIPSAARASCRCELFPMDGGQAWLRGLEEVDAGEAGWTRIKEEEEEAAAVVA